MLRAAWRRAEARPAEGVTTEELFACFDEGSGLALAAQARALIESTTDPDFTLPLAHVGLRLAPKRRQGEGEFAPRAEQSGWLGAVFDPDSDDTIVQSVPEGSPAEHGGLLPGDDLVAVGGFRVRGRRELEARLAQRPPGRFVTLALFRHGRLEQPRVLLSETPHFGFEVLPVEAATDAQRRAHEAWLGAPCDECSVMK